MKEIGEDNIIYKLQEKGLERERTAMLYLMKTVSELMVWGRNHMREKTERRKGVPSLHTGNRKKNNNEGRICH